MTISVGKKWDAGAVYIGRGTPLGNPFIMHGETDRDRVCDCYQAWFDARVESNDAAVMDELRRLYRLAAAGDLVLGCYCAPRRCHGDTIKAFLSRFVASASS